MDSKNLIKKALQIRLDILKAIKIANKGHIGVTNLLTRTIFWLNFY